jgi:hypothetical protein
MPTTCTDWTTRFVPEAWGPERLGAYVESAVSAVDGMLFTATPREELDAIGRFQQLKDQAWVGLMREIVAAYNRATFAEREFAGDEVALAIGAAPGTGDRLVSTALAAAALPGLLEAVSAGMLTERHVLAVLRELDAVELLLEQRQAIVLLALARYDRHTPRELGDLIRRLVLLIDLPAARDREAQATTARSVRCYPDVDGQAVLHARGPLAMIAAIKASLEATLGERVEGDDRSKDAREFDLFVDLLTGSETPSGWHAHVVVPFTTALGGEVELADVPGFGPILPGTAKDLVEEAVALTPVAVDPDGAVFAAGDPVTPTAAPAHAQAPADGEVSAAGSGTTPAQAERPQTPAPIAPEPADAEPNDVSAPAAEPSDEAPTKVATPDEAATKVATTDAVRAAILAMGRVPAARSLGSGMGVAGYRVPTRVERFLEARDRTCVFPGGHRPAQDTDKGHRIPWPTGPTDPENLQCLCRHHHRGKQTAFTVELIDGDHRWTTRGGWSLWRRHQGY